MTLSDMKEDSQSSHLLQRIKKKFYYLYKYILMVKQISAPVAFETSCGVVWKSF